MNHFAAHIASSGVTAVSNLTLHRLERALRERVRYRYVRGMTSERLGQRDEARHWLVLARESVEQRPTALDEETRALLQRTLLPYDQTTGANVNPPASSPVGTTPPAAPAQSARTRSEPRTTP